MNTKTIMYHYTDEKGYIGILQSKLIRPSLKANNPKDARFGDGQYFTDIIPNTKRPGQLSRIFLGVPWLGSRFSHHLDIKTHGLKVEYGRPNVYVIKSESNLYIHDRLAGHGKLGL